MLRHYVTIALRSLRRHAGYAFLNAFGLALGLACAFLAVLFIRDELGQDAVHEKADRIALVSSANLTTPYPLADAIRDHVPGVERVVRTGWGAGLVRLPGEAQQREIEGAIQLTDSTFLDVFTFPLAQGDPATALDRIDGLVVTERVAQSLFGTPDALGKTLDVQVSNVWHTLTVTGVAEDPPKNTTVGFSALVRLELRDARSREPDGWGLSAYYTYALLENGVTRAAFDTSLVAMGRAHDPHFKGEQSSRTFFATPLRDFYLSDLSWKDGFKGDVLYLKLFGAIALVVLLIASINYVNLATARGVERAREVGVRKALGAGRAQVSRQMLVESGLLALAAGVLALALTALALPAFNAFFGKGVSLGFSDAPLVAGLLGIALATGLLAGVYPALVLTRYRPTEVLKAGTPAGPGGHWLRRGLVVAQFAATIGLLVYTGILYGQIRFAQQAYTLPQDHTLVAVDLPSAAQASGEVYKRALEALPGVESATAATSMQGVSPMSYGFNPDSTRPDFFVAVAMFVGDGDHLETLSLPLVAGRALDPTRTSDQNAVLVNEALVREMGWTEAIGQTLPLFGEANPIVGVVEDFYFSTVAEPVGGVAFALTDPEDPSRQPSKVIAKVRGDRIGAFLAALPEAWNSLSDAPLKYRFADEIVEGIYTSERKTAQVLGFFALVALLVACMGLVGLAALAAAQRTREMGIRKALGATIPGLLALQTRGFLALVGVACLVAMPVAYYAGHRWLEGFALRMPIGPGVFVAVGLGAAGLAFLAVSTQTYRAARIPPSEALRYE